MLIKNLSPWAGPNFYFELGAVIDVPNHVGRDRIEAGVATEHDGKGETPTVHVLPPAKLAPKAEARK